MSAWVTDKREYSDVVAMAEGLVVCALRLTNDLKHVTNNARTDTRHMYSMLEKYRVPKINCAGEG